MSSALIATRHKEKLPAGYSYPIGAEALSNALHGLLEPSGISLLFSWRDEFWASKYQQKLVVGGDIRVLVVSFFEHWHISVNAVPSTDAKLARDLLSEFGLPSLREALQRMSKDADFFRWCATYSLATKTLELGTPPEPPARRRRAKFRAPIR